jgi:hypothetical protein
VSASPRKPNWDRLYETAGTQEGYFTTKQAADAGYSPQLLAKHLRARRIARAQRGIYRLVHFPAGDHEDLVIAWLWTERTGVISYQTALSLHELSEREERGRRRSRLLEELRRGPVDGHQEPLGHRGGRVVEGTVVVVELERAKPQELGEPEAGREGFVARAAHRRPGAVELLGAPVADEGLQRVEREAAGVRVERREREGTARVRDPRSRGDRRRNLGDRPVGHADDDQVGLARLQLRAGQAGGQRLGEASGEGGADPSGADDAG